MLPSSEVLARDKAHQQVEIQSNYLMNKHVSSVFTTRYWLAPGWHIIAIHLRFAPVLIQMYLHRQAGAEQK